MIVLSVNLLIESLNYDTTLTFFKIFIYSAHSQDAFEAAEKRRGKKYHLKYDN